MSVIKCKKNILRSNKAKISQVVQVINCAKWNKIKQNKEKKGNTNNKMCKISKTKYSAITRSNNDSIQVLLKVWHQCWGVGDP